MIEVGDRAPEVLLKDTAGATIRLGHYHRERDLLVYFMRATGCPMCNRHVRHLREQAAVYAGHGVDVLVAVPDDADTASRWASGKNLPFPVVTGTTHTPHADLGLTRGFFGSMQQSGTVLIDRDGIIRYREVATIPTGGYSHTAVIAAIQNLRHSRTGK